MTVQDTATGIAHERAQKRTYLVAIDARGGSGKSTLAGRLSELLADVTIVHLDDFAYPTTGVDRRRLLERVILPLKADGPARYQRYDWEKKQLAEWHEIQPGGIVIIEGVLTLHELLYQHYDFRIWIECPAEVGFERGLARDRSQYGVDTAQQWTEIWMPEEARAIEEQQPHTRADLVLDGTKPFM